MEFAALRTAITSDNLNMDEKEEFLNEFGEDYGYPNGPKSIDEIRATEFKRLDENGSFPSFFSC